MGDTPFPTRNTVSKRATLTLLHMFRTYGHVPPLHGPTSALQGRARSETPNHCQNHSNHFLRLEFAAYQRQHGASLTPRLSHVSDIHTLLLPTVCMVCSQTLCPRLPLSQRSLHQRQPRHLQQPLPPPLNPPRRPVARVRVRVAQVVLRPLLRLPRQAVTRASLKRHWRMKWSSL